MKKRGVNFNERELAANVRTLALKEVEKVLKKGKGRLYEAVLVRLSGTLLPRLNELSGTDGQPLAISISGTVATKYGINGSAG